MDSFFLQVKDGGTGHQQDPLMSKLFYEETVNVGSKELEAYFPSVFTEAEKEPD